MNLASALLRPMVVHPDRPTVESDLRHSLEPEPAELPIETHSRGHADWIDVVQRVRAGDAHSLSRLVSLITSFLHKYGAYRIRESWEDVCQDVLMSLVRRVEQGDLRSPNAFVSYAAAITRTCYLDFVERRARVTSGGRRNERWAAVPIEQAAALDSKGLDLDWLLELRQQMQCIDPRTRRVLTLIYLEGRSYIETSTELDLPLGTIKRLQTAGLRELRERMGVTRRMRTPRAPANECARSRAPLD